MSARRTYVILLVAFLAALAGAACGARSEEAVSPSPSPGPETAGGANADSLGELEDLFWSRLDSARTRYTEADVHFMSGMIGHHAQAIVMARLAPDRAENASVRTLAARIISAQEDEIVLMQQWLRDRGEPVPEVHLDETTHGTHRAGDGALMPGMLSPEQMSRLAEASGAEFDHRFLSYMIQHHRGAVTMVAELFATDGAGQDPTVFRFASDVQVDQRTEIARMERMLMELFQPDAASSSTHKDPS